MSIMIDKKFYLLLLIFVSLSGVCEADQKKSGIFSNWQNPDIGMTLDGVVDLDDAEGPWKSQGINLRGAELIVSANIDPYAFLAGNILLTEHGAELHEAYSLFPYLPFNLKLKLGKCWQISDTGIFIMFIPCHLQVSRISTRCMQMVCLR